MSVLTGLRRFLAQVFYPDAFRPVPNQSIISSDKYRAKQGQSLDAATFLYAPKPEYDRALVATALSVWGYTAVQRMSEMAVSVFPKVRNKATLQDYEHPLMGLIGEYGRPNDYMDSFEFLEQHFQQLDIQGNVFWHFVSTNGRYPTEVHILDPKRVDIKFGSSQRVGAYIYRVMGKEFTLYPSEVLHFKRAHLLPESVYGLSLADMLLREIAADDKMLNWNFQLFEGGSANGYLVLPPSTPETEVRRIQEEVDANISEKRRVLVFRAPSDGDIAFHGAGVNHHELEFKEGRILTRDAVFNLIGFHAGLVSESSTEAHARIARSQVLHSVWGRHVRTASLLQMALAFWPAPQKYQVYFPDVREADWSQMSLKLRAVQPYMTVNEVRTHYLSLPPVDWGERQDNGNSVNGKQGANAGDTGAAETGSGLGSTDSASSDGQPDANGNTPEPSAQDRKD